MFLEPCQTFLKEQLVKATKPLDIFTKSSITNVQQGCKYASELVSS